MTSQPVDSGILHEIVRIIESRRKVPDKVIVTSKEYLLTYLEDHRNRLEEALTRFDSDRLNMLYGQLASKVKYQLIRRVPARAAAAMGLSPGKPAAKAEKRAAAKPAAKKATAVKPKKPAPAKGKKAGPAKKKAAPAKKKAASAKKKAASAKKKAAPVKKKAAAAKAKKKSAVGKSKAGSRRAAARPKKKSGR